jgi:hypothetical protein
VDLLTARSAIKEVPHWEGELVLHWLKLAFKIEGHEETTQLTSVKARHLQRSCIREIVNVEALHASYLKRSFLLLQRDVKEYAINNSDGMQQAKETHQYNGYRVDSGVDYIIVDIVCVRDSLDSQDEQELLSHCCDERQDCGKGNMESKLEVGFTETEVEPTLLHWRRFVSAWRFGAWGMANHGG